MNQMTKLLTNCDATRQDAVDVARSAGIIARQGTMVKGVGSRYTNWGIHGELVIRLGKGTFSEAAIAARAIVPSASVRHGEHGVIVLLTTLGEINHLAFRLGDRVSQQVKDAVDSVYSEDGLSGRRDLYNRLRREANAVRPSDAYRISHVSIDSEGASEVAVSLADSDADILMHVGSIASPVASEDDVIQAFFGEADGKAA